MGRRNDISAAAFPRSKLRYLITMHISIDS